MRGTARDVFRDRRVAQRRAIAVSARCHHDMREHRIA